MVGLDPAVVNNEMETDEAAMNFKNNSELKSVEIEQRYLRDPRFSNYVRSKMNKIIPHTVVSGDPESDTAAIEDIKGQIEQTKRQREQTKNDSVQNVEEDPKKLPASVIQEDKCASRAQSTPCSEITIKSLFSTEKSMAEDDQDTTSSDERQNLDDEDDEVLLLSPPLNLTDVQLVSADISLNVAGVLSSGTGTKLGPRFKSLPPKLNPGDEELLVSGASVRSDGVIRLVGSETRLNGTDTTISLRFQPLLPQVNPGNCARCASLKDLCKTCYDAQNN